MNRRTETRGFQGGFIPSELKNTTTNEQNTKTDTQWQGSFDREESLSYPRWHIRPPTKGKKTNNNTPKQPNTDTTKVQDARELITKKKVEETRQKSKNPKTFFTDSQTEKKPNGGQEYQGPVENKVLPNGDHGNPQLFDGLPDGDQSDIQLYPNYTIWRTKVGG